jgi:AraC-like DNA-binding protein
MFASASAARLPIELAPHVREGRYFALAGEPERSLNALCGGREVCPPPYSINRASFPFWIIEVIAEGSGELELGGTQYTLRPGSWFTYGPHIPHRIEAGATEGLTKFFVAVRSPAPPALWREAGLEAGTAGRVHGETRILRTCAEILEEGVRDSLETSALTAHLYNVLVWRLGRAVREGRRQAAVPHLARQTMEIIDREFATIPSLTALALRVGVTPEHLCRSFRGAFGESPYQVLLQRKLHHAANLLRDGPWQVAEVARAAGFEDPYHFSRIFKKFHGVAPSRLTIR